MENVPLAATSSAACRCTICKALDNRPAFRNFCSIGVFATAYERVEGSYLTFRVTMKPMIYPALLLHCLFPSILIRWTASQHRILRRRSHNTSHSYFGSRSYSWKNTVHVTIMSACGGVFKDSMGRINPCISLCIQTIGQSMQH